VSQRRISPVILPSPGEVTDRLPELFQKKDDSGRTFYANFLQSLKRIGWAYLIAVLIALPLGIFMGSFGIIRSMFSPTVTASGYIPIATLLPLTMSWFGIGEKQKVVFLSMAFFIYLLPAVIKAIDGVPDVYLRTASTLGTNKWQSVFKVLVPIALPDIWYGMRLAFGVGWTYLVLAEVVVLDGGLGHVIAIAQRRGPREHIYIVIVLITLVAWAADLLWDRTGKLLFPYRVKK
jgi:NitT/TauT family transport system permease protein